ncbi:MAG: GNAT family N-acetyltransferase, partial [Microcella sp.]
GAGDIDASRPLSARIPAPELPALAGPDGVTWRATRDDDVEAIAALLAAMAERDHPDWSETADEIAEEFSHSYVDVARDSVVAEDAGGQMIAHGMAMRAPEPVDYARVWLSGGVHPAHRGRGIGRQLLAWQTARAEQLLAELELTIPGWVLSYAADRSPEHGRLLERAEFTPSRYFTTLHAELSEATLEPRPLPEGIRLEPWSARFSEGARAAKNAAFADHWGSQPATREGWESWQTLPTFRPELSRLALAGEEVVGFITTDINEDDWARMGRSSGYIGLVGTVREWRGKGLASALLVDVMRAYRAQGLELAVLDVDTANPTGALGVYERLGFAAVARDVAYRRLY